MVRSLIQASPVLWLHAPTRGVSPLAAPFFSSQAEPFSRRRDMPDLWWCLLAFGENLSYMCASLFVAYAWCHFESACDGGSVHPSLHVLASMELHVFDGLAYFAKAVLEADSQNIRISSGGIRVTNGASVLRVSLAFSSCGFSTSFWLT